MSAGASRHLGRVSDSKHLNTAGQFGETHADRIRHGTAHAGVYLVEHERGRRAAVGQRHLQGEQKASQLAEAISRSMNTLAAGFVVAIAGALILAYFTLRRR